METTFPVDNSARQVTFYINTHTTQTLFSKAQNKTYVAMKQTTTNYMLQIIHSRDFLREDLDPTYFFPDTFFLFAVFHNEVYFRI